MGTEPPDRKFLITAYKNWEKMQGFHIFHAGEIS